MIDLSNDFDLGNDRTRIKDQRDAQRQRQTAQELLRRMFHPEPARRWELQLVADEVGMGKTFVALAVAYSLLHGMGSAHGEPDLRGCARRVLVIAPQNASLTKKWRREVQEFVRRCVPDERVRQQARAWFMGGSEDTVPLIERLDDLAQNLRSDTPGVVVTHMGVFTGGKKFVDYDLKRRLLLGALFRVWGNAFPHDDRARLLKGAPAGWPRNADELTRLSEESWRRVPFDSEKEVVAALRSLRDADQEIFDKLLTTCREIAAPYVREREDKFPAVEKLLNRLYRSACFALVQHAIPLVIVDEAHNWKNGPTASANGYGGFTRLIAPHTRRVLLLTATPFQLRPQEMLELLKVGTAIAPCAEHAESELRRTRMEHHRETVIRPVLESAARQSRAFAAAWGRLPRAQHGPLPLAWSELAATRVALSGVARAQGALDQQAVERIVDTAVAKFHPDLRELLREGLRLYAINEDLSQELGELVIRHRRRTDHRLVRVGAEYVERGEAVAGRPDRHLLHVAPGINVSGPAELPHYLLMRCVTEMKQGKGRSSLGSALTGCYSTLIGSSEGRDLRKALVGGRGAAYFKLLTSMVSEEQDEAHPKVSAVVNAVIAAWHAGEKALVFCFRINTARRLHAIVNRRITEELDAKRAAVLGSEAALNRLRSRLTRRDGDLIALGLDRVLWSLLWAARTSGQTLADPERVLKVTDEELVQVARLALRHGVDLAEDSVDRVFLHRAIEHVVARRLLERRAIAGPPFEAILQAMASEAWVERAYGVAHAATDEDGSSESSREVAGVDERGVHAVYPVRHESPSAAEVSALALRLRERREHARSHAQSSVVDAYAEAPSFWLGRSPELTLDGNPSAREHVALARLHEHLLTLSFNGSEIDWLERLVVCQALRRAIMRESVLVRLLPERSELDEHGWGELLVERYFAPLPGQQESTADRLSVFLEDLQAADGSVRGTGTTRSTMYEATRMRDQSGFAVLVDGSTETERRERVFAGFNSPLLPEVLICTSVGQEGIDLHRHCRHVIHYDLAWNPAVLEQRTGRVDRIGSKTFRERQIERSAASAGPFLDVGVPFLAGTYDERMYEEIRVRAQTFEVLTGGDMAADNMEGADIEGAEGSEAGLGLPVLPPSVVDDLRVRLHVWEASDDAG